MYSNGSHDHDLNRKIDKILTSGQPSGDPVLDDLATTVPQANRDFQDRLETDLIARLHAVNDQHRSKNKMNAAIPLSQAHTVRRLNFAVPATLVAAMLAVVVMGTIFIGMNRPGSNFTAGSQISATNTPTPTPVQVITSTPIPTIPPVDGPIFPTIVPPLDSAGLPVLPGVENVQLVIVARDHIPAGTVLTADLLTFAYYPAESVPEGAYTRLEDPIGITVASFVPRGYPITPGLMMSSENTATPIPFSGVATIVPPEGSVVVDLPLALVPVSADNLANVYPGAVLDVVAAVMYIDAGTVDATPVYQVIEPRAGAAGALSFTTVYNAVIIEVVDPLDVENGYVSLSLAPDQAVILNYLIEAHVPMYLSQQPVPDVRPIEGLPPTWVPTATPFPANMDIDCQVQVMPGGNLWVQPSVDAGTLEGRAPDEVFKVLTMLNGQDGRLWYYVQRYDGSPFFGWIMRDEAKIVGICAMFDPTTLVPTIFSPVSGTATAVPDVLELTATPLPTVTPLATATPIQP